MCGVFAVRCGAGDVFYNVAKFNQKNRENLTADMKDLMASSSNELVVDVRVSATVFSVIEAAHHLVWRSLLYCYISSYQKLKCVTNVEMDNIRRAWYGSARVLSVIKAATIIWWYLTLSYEDRLCITT